MWWSWLLPHLRQTNLTNAHCQPYQIQFIRKKNDFNFFRFLDSKCCDFFVFLLILLIFMFLNEFSTWNWFWILRNQRKNFSSHRSKWWKFACHIKKCLVKDESWFSEETPGQSASLQKKQKQENEWNQRKKKENKRNATRMITSAAQFGVFQIDC